MLITVFVIGLAFGFGVAFKDGFTLETFRSGWTIGFAFAFFAAIVGAAPAIFVGGSVYCLLVLTNRAGFVSTVLIGAVPGVVLGLLGHPFALLFVGVGVPCAAMTHVLYIRNATKQKSA